MFRCMKVSFLRQKLAELGKDHEWLAHQCGVAPVTMKQNYLRGIMPIKPVALNIRSTLSCSFADFLYPEEMEALSLTDDRAS